MSERILNYVENALGMMDPQSRAMAVMTNAEPPGERTTNGEFASALFNQTPNATNEAGKPGVDEAVARGFINPQTGQTTTNFQGLICTELPADSAAAFKQAHKVFDPVPPGVCTGGKVESCTEANIKAHQDKIQSLNKEIDKATCELSDKINQREEHERAFDNCVAKLTAMNDNCLTIGNCGKPVKACPCKPKSIPSKKRQTRKYCW